METSEIFVPAAISTEVYRAIVENSPAAIFVGTPDGQTIHYANSAACAMFGYTENEILRLNRTALLCCDSALSEAIVKRNSTGHYIGVITGKRKNGEQFPCEVSSFLFEDTDGVQKAFATIRDISEQKAIEEELRKSNERYRLATRASFDAIWDADLVNETINWGEGFETLFGHKVGSFPTQSNTWEKYIHPEDRERVIKQLNIILTTHKNQCTWTDEYRFLKSDGSVAYILDRGIILRDADGKAIRMVGAMQDITELKQKEEELKKINNRYYTATKATSDVVWDWDLENNLVEWACNFSNIMGHPLPADFKLPLDFCYSNFHPEDRSRVLKSLEEAIQDPNRTNWKNEFRYRKADGSFAHVVDRAFILRNANGKAYRLIGAIQDISLLKEKEQQLIQQEIQKQNAISQAILETQEKERTEIGKELHDNINQLLTTAKLYLDIALAEPERKSHLIQKSAEQIVQVISEIRSLCETLMAPSLGDLGLMDSLQGLAESFNITQKLSVHLCADPTLENLLSENTKLVIYRIVQEALNNAVKYADADKITITLSNNQTHFSLTIRDNGKGFDPTTIKKGSGLKNMQHRVYLFNGSFQLNTAPGKGCELKITIPFSHS